MTISNIGCYKEVLALIIILVVMIIIIITTIMIITGVHMKGMLLAIL